MTSFTINFPYSRKSITTYILSAFFIAAAYTTINLKSYYTSQKPLIQAVETTTNYKSLYQRYFKRTKVISGVIDYSFISSIINAGLNKYQVKALLHLLEGRFEIISSVKNGDKFSIKYDTDSQNRKYLSSFYYLGSKKNFFIYQDSERNLYNKNGINVHNLNYFTYPLNKKYRISSSFNLKRLHPITHRIAPHYGTDYAVPIGTKVLSIADGTVEKSNYNRFAGNYINVRHTDGTRSRYLHLSKQYVSEGDKVSAGQLIALSGNTGRTTGPHLHLELIVDGVPVDYESYAHHLTAPPIDPQIVKAIKLEQQEHEKHLQSYDVNQTS